MRRLLRCASLAVLVWLLLTLGRSLWKQWVQGPPVRRASGWRSRWAEEPARPRPKVGGVQSTGGIEYPAATAAAEDDRTSHIVKASSKKAVARKSPDRPGEAKKAAKKAAGPGGKAAGKKVSGQKTAGQKTAGQKTGGRKTAKAAKPRSWVLPNGSAELLETHPVKAKVASRLYRVPGMPAYDRTVPDRCYPSSEAAEADGFTRATR